MAAQLSRRDFLKIAAVSAAAVAGAQLVKEAQASGSAPDG